MNKCAEVSLGFGFLKINVFNRQKVSIFYAHLWTCCQWMTVQKWMFPI